MAFGFIYLAGAVGFGLYYWATAGRHQEFIVGRTKTAFAAVWWPGYIVMLLASRNKAEAKQIETDALKRRVLE